MAPKMQTTYKELDLVWIPEYVPELGIEAETRRPEALRRGQP
jgi:hypothetical protein